MFVFVGVAVGGTGVFVFVGVAVGSTGAKPPSTVRLSPPLYATEATACLLALSKLLSLLSSPPAPTGLTFKPLSGFPLLKLALSILTV